MDNGNGIKSINRLLARELTEAEINMVAGGDTTYQYYGTAPTGNPPSDAVIDRTPIDAYT